MQLSSDEYVIWSVVIFSLLFPKMDTHFEKGSRLQVTESVWPPIEYSSNRVEGM